MKCIERESVRFVLAGGINAVATYAAYLLMLPVTGYALAYSITYVGGIILSYYLSARLVFRSPLRWRHAVQYPLVYIVQYALGITLTTIFIKHLHIRAELVLPLVIAIAVPITFWMTRWIIKREKSNDRSPTSCPS